MSRMKLLRIPRAFYDDHVGRELPTPEAVRENSRFVYIRSDDTNLDELINDASYYAHPHGPDDEGARWVVAAAKRLLKAIQEQTKG